MKNSPQLYDKFNSEPNSYFFLFYSILFICYCCFFYYYTVINKDEYNFLTKFV